MSKRYPGNRPRGIQIFILAIFVSFSSCLSPATIEIPLLNNFEVFDENTSIMVKFSEKNDVSHLNISGPLILSVFNNSESTIWFSKGTSARLYLYVPDRGKWQEVEMSFKSVTATDAYTLYPKLSKNTFFNIFMIHPNINLAEYGVDPYKLRLYIFGKIIEDIFDITDETVVASVEFNWDPFANFKSTADQGEFTAPFTTIKSGMMQDQNFGNLLTPDSKDRVICGTSPGFRRSHDLIVTDEIA